MLSNPSQHFNTQAGFTFIEIMIAIAVTAILAAICLISYQTQMRQAQIMIVYQEINQFRMPYQISIDEGARVTEFSPNSLSVPAKTKYCKFSVIAPNINDKTFNAVTCDIHDLSYLKNQSINLDRAADGSWQCRPSAGIPKSYLPKACQ